jgi:biofilm protein TabA
MIFDDISAAAQYYGISKRLDRALALLPNTDFQLLSAGKYTADEGIYYTVMDCKLKNFEQTKWECHDRFLDIQILLEEGERIAVWPAGLLDGWGAYSEQNDVRFSESEAHGTVLSMRPSTFAVFFPGDAHRPCWAEHEEKTVRKVVIKVPV